MCFVSPRLIEGHAAIPEACHLAWNASAENAERIGSLCLSPWLKKLIG